MLSPILQCRLTRVLLACMIVAALAATGCKSPEERFADHIERADEYVANGQRKEAILELTSALNIDPSSPEINERVARLMSRQGAVETAARYFLEAYNLDPTRTEAAMRHAQLVAWTQRERADRLVAESLARDPENPIVHRTVAELALIDGDLDAAIVAAQRAIDLDDSDAESWIEMGRVRQGSISASLLTESVPPNSAYELALAAFTRADELRGGDVGVKLELARVLAAWRGKVGRTVAAYNEALSFAKQQGDAESISLAAHAFAEYGAKSGRNDLVVKGLREAVAIAPDSVATWRRLAEASDLARPGAGEAVFAELLEQRASDPRAHRAYTNYLASQNRAREAVAHLEEALAGDIDSPAMWDDLIRYRLQRAQLAAAQEGLAELEKRASDHPVTQRARARVAMAEGRNGKAVELLRTMPAAANSVEGQRLLALAELRRGNLDEAGAAIDRSIALSDEFSMQSMRLKARIHHDSDEWAEAFAAFREIGQHRVALTNAEKLMIARSMYEQRYRRAGRGVLEEILANDDFDPLAAVEFARREGRDDPDTAMGYLNTARARAPGSYPVLEAMVRIHRQQKHWDTAISITNEAISAGHGGPQAVLLRAELLADMGELARAESDALRAFESAPALPGAVDLLIRIYRDQDKLATAERSFEEAEAAGVLHTGARRLLGRLYAERGDLEKAQEMLEKVISDRPRLGGAKTDLAVLLLDQNSDPERALTLAREGAESQNLDPRAAFVAGAAYHRNGLDDAALVEYRRAIALDRSRDGRLAPSLQYHLGVALQALDRRDQAAAAFSSALELSADFPEADAARRQLEETRKTS